MARADIPDSGVIHSCYSTRTGTRRVIDTSADQGCHPGEKGLGWNQAGPQGPPGPSDAYSVFINDSPSFGQSAIDVASIALPTGNFVIIANTELFNFTPTATVSGGCLLTDSTHQLSLGGIGATVGTGEADPLTVTGVATLASPTTVVLQCNGPGMYVSGGRIIATKVGALH